jgi:fructose-1-phosphate kinase PfkB-like protein
VAVVDTSGAGDAFVGAFARALAGGAPALAAAESAVSCASLTVSMPGTQASFAQSATGLIGADGIDGGGPLASSERTGNTRTGG